MDKINKPTMLTYIEETPDQLLININRSKDLTKELVDLYLEKEYKNIWIIACGSSNNGCQCAKPFMMKYLNCDVKIISPNTFVYYDNKIEDNDFIFVVSQSGCSTNSLNALNKIKKLGRKAIGVTGNICSDFKEYADIVIDYGVGIETIGYATKGVVTLIEYLILFSLESSLHKNLLTPKKYQSILLELKEIPSRHQVIQRETWEFYKKNKSILTSMSVVYTCGFIQAYGIASEAALKIGETIQIPSFSYEAEEYIHGPNLQLTPNYTVFFIDDLMQGSQRLTQIYKATKSVTDRVFMITNNKLIDDDHALRIPFAVEEELLSPLYLLPFFQIIAYQVTEDLNKWNKHPMFSKFKSLVNYKTDTIKQIMPDSR